MFTSCDFGNFQQVFYEDIKLLNFEIQGLHSNLHLRPFNLYFYLTRSLLLRFEIIKIFHIFTWNSHFNFIRFVALKRKTFCFGIFNASFLCSFFICSHLKIILSNIHDISTLMLAHLRNHFASEQRGQTFHFIFKSQKYVYSHAII